MNKQVDANNIQTMGSLDNWLSYIEKIHAVEIDLGLERIKIVADRLKIQIAGKVITVGGTNGKGTTCAFLETALLDLGKNVVVYSSPHITQFNERLRLNKKDVIDSELVAAFSMVEQARAEVSLSYYEFTTLAALLVVQKWQPDYVILEVGLGGRLDATNMIDSDVAVITTIDLDHQSFLGDTREKIAFEKAGIMRRNKSVVIGDTNPPLALAMHANQIGANIVQRNQQFEILSENEYWSYLDNKARIKIDNLIKPFIPKDNVATALAVLQQLAIDLTKEKINRWIKNTQVAGRLEQIANNPTVLLDVGHNPQAARYLADQIKHFHYKKLHVVVAMLADKDIANTIKPLIHLAKHWYLGSLAVPRGAHATVISEHLAQFSVESNCFDNVTEAYKMACKAAEPDDLILVYGSFYTVAQIRPLIK